MKISAFTFKALFRWLILPALLCVSLLPMHSAHAAGPCSLEHQHITNITSDETWCVSGGSTHYLDNDITVLAGVTLTIEAGVTVDSHSDNWSKYLTIQGHLDIAGTAAQPVLLTRSFNYPNQNWSGLFFDGSQGDGSGTINYATITHAGSNFLPPSCVGVCGNAQTAVFVKDLTAGKQVTINHSTITDNVSKGLFVVNSTVSVSNTTFSQNQYPIWIEGENSDISYASNTFSNNAYPYFDNINYTVQEDSIILGANALLGHNFNLTPQNGLDAYVFPSGTNIPAGITMTIEPGATARFARDKYLTIQGYLQAVGTPALPILFSGIPSSTPGVDLYWGGLFFDGTAGDGSGTIRYAIINRGGSNYLPPACAGACGSAQTAVFIKDLPTGEALTIGYSTIQNSLGKGLYLVNSQAAHVDSNLIKGGRIGVDFVSNMTVSNLALIDQAYDGMIIESGYHVDARHLTIARAGQSGLHIYSGGTGLLQNSILSQNALAVWAEGSGSATLNSNLSDANTVFQSGAVTATNTVAGSASFEADGYHIQDTSAAICMGMPDLANLDMDGDARPWPAGSLPDLGADEITAGSEKLFTLFIPLVSR